MSRATGDKSLIQQICQLSKQDSNLPSIQSLLYRVPTQHRTAIVNARVEVLYACDYTNALYCPAVNFSIVHLNRDTTATYIPANDIDSGIYCIFEVLMKYFKSTFFTVKLHSCIIGWEKRSPYLCRVQYNQYRAIFTLEGR